MRILTRHLLIAFAVCTVFILTACTVSLLGDITPPVEFQITQGPFNTPAAVTPTGRFEPPSGTIQPGKIAICGKVNNGSGSEIPANLVVSLKGFDQQHIALQTSLPLDENFYFCFSNIDHEDKRQYRVETDYKGLIFQSEMVEGGDIPSGSTVDLSVTIYDTTRDMSALEIERAHVFLDFSGREQSMNVIQLFVISNLGMYAIVPPETGEPLLYFDLPQDMYNLTLEGGRLGKRFIETQFGFGDSEPILPGSSQHQVLYTYELPYENEENILLSMPLPVNSLTVAIPAKGVKLESTMLLDSGTRLIQGISMRLYKASGLSAGQQVDMAISGWPPNARPPGGRALGNLILGLSGFMLALIAIISWLVFMTRNLRLHSTEISAESEQDILDAIITLDDLYRSGEISENAYRPRRAELKEQLRQEAAKKRK